MAKDPVKAIKFKLTLAKLLSAPPKPHADMKLGKSKKKKARKKRD